MKKERLLYFLLSAGLIFLYGCGGNISKVSRPFLGTVVTITIAAEPEKTVEAFNAAFSEIEYVQKTFSIYDQKSEISKVNLGAYNKPVKVSGEVYSLISAALEVSEKTDGAFDITWASTGRLWDFSREEFSPPDEKTVKSLLPLISYRNVILDEKGKSVRLLKNGTKIGLGGVAKGYAVKRAMAALKSRELRGAIVACAGDIQAAGDNNGKPWKAAIQDPRGNSVIAAFEMNDGDSVSTSGDYERFRIINGKRYHHIINPATGYPADSGVISVTVFGGDPVISDAYSTAFFVAGLEKTVSILKSLHGVSAVLVDSDMTVHVSSSLRGRLQFRENLRVLFF